MFILSSISNGLDFWSVNHTLIYENLESNVMFWNIQNFGMKYLMIDEMNEINVYKTLEYFW